MEAPVKETPKTEKSEEVEVALELTDISQLGRITKTEKILKGVTVAFQTLTAAHQHQILASLPPNSLDPIGKYTAMQIETLVYATLSINNKKYAESDKDELRTFYSNLQNKVLQTFYDFYLRVNEDQNKVIESLKKT